MTPPNAALSRALVEALDDEALDALADRLAPRLVGRSADKPAEADRWLDARDAAAYLGLPSVGALHKLTAARAIPFEQDGPGCKLWFRPSELDGWRRGGAVRDGAR